MLSRLNEFDSVLFGEEDYLQDIDSRLPKLDGEFLKIERRQVFQEPWDASWNAMAEGDWPRAVELIDQNRLEIEKELDSFPGFRRIRIVEDPPTDYLQWEFMLFRRRVECGEKLFVVQADSIRSFEVRRTLPEIIILADGPMYEILYDEDGLHYGGRRFDQADVVSACRAEIDLLAAQGEPFSGYFRREIEPRVSARMHSGEA